MTAGLVRYGLFTFSQRIAMFELLPHTHAGSVLPVELPGDLIANHMQQAPSNILIDDQMPPPKQ
jgi:hypothetical protein